MATFRRRALMVLGALSVLCACTREEGPQRLGVVDDRGDTVRVRAPVTRVVSLIPATTELLFAIGAGETVVGRTQWDTEPPAAKEVPVVGVGMMWLGANIDNVVRRRPDLVLLDPSAQNDEVAQQLDLLAIPTLRVALNRLDDVERVAKILGQVTGHEAGADSVVQALRSGLAPFATPPRKRATRVFVLAWDQPILTVGRGSYLSEVVELAGGVNVFDERDAVTLEVSLEEVARRRPDVVLLAGVGPPADSRWRVVDAVREKRVIPLPASLLWPGPRTPDGVRTLAAAFGPD